MDSIRPTSAPTKSKLAKTIQKVIHLKTATKTLSNNGFCLITPQERFKRDTRRHSRHFNKDEDSEEAKLRNRAVMEAFVAKLFASLSAAKAAYAALQMAQFPYNGEAIQSADEAVVFELKELSELKHSFLKKQIDSSPPHVTILLAEIQEQQSLMKMYEITMKKMQTEIEAKESGISSLQTELKDTISNNKSLEKKLNSSQSFTNSILDNVKPLDSNPKDFIIVLHYAIRSVRSFVKLMIREMEYANWDIDSAASAIEPEVIFPKPNHRCFAFESFVCTEMFDGFNGPCFSLRNDSSLHDDRHRRFQFIDRFKKLKSANPIQFLRYNPNSTFGKFTRTKYLQLIHPKMEASFSRDLNQRKVIESGGYPETAFFTAFAEMARRVWLLHCVAFSFDQEVNIFQVRKNSRFSEVYMESVTEEEVHFTAADDGGDGDFQAAFTVVPGFKIGKTVIQSQVYLSPAKCARALG